MISEAPRLLAHTGAGLWPLLQDDEVEDVAIQCPGEAWVCVRGKWRREEVPLTVKDIEEIAILAGALSKREVDEHAPLHDEYMPNGERLAICLPPAVELDKLAVKRHGLEDGRVPSLTFRKHDENIAEPSTIEARYRTSGWNKWERLQGGRDWTELTTIYDAGNFSALLTASVQAQLNILQVGKTGVGKTTLNKTACSAIDDSERLITVEDTIELALKQPNVVRLLARGDITFSAALKMTLRMRASRVMLQEVRDGAAAWTLISDVIGPHPGVVTTIHGHDAVSGLSRLAWLLRSAPEGRGMTTEDIGWALNNSIDLVIPLHLGDDGVRDIFPVWFAGDAIRRKETIADLLRS